MYFYLKWLDKRPECIKILKEKPNDINFIDTFKIKKDNYFICGNINKSLLNYYAPHKKEYTKVHYLSSHLQKCIRRMDDYRSVKTAKHYIDLDLTSFLRRLPIIMLEDVCLDRSFPIIIWFMISVTKGFQIKENMIRWLLGIVYNLSLEKKKELYLKDEKIIEYNIDDFNDNDQVLLYSLIFRCCYGGMKGDMMMINHYLNRFINKDPRLIITNNKIPRVVLSIKSLKKSEWLYEANDFHCNKYIVNQILAKHPNYKSDKIKSLIWENSSSINYREEQYKKNDKDWILIEDTVKRVQKNCKYQ